MIGGKVVQTFEDKEGRTWVNTYDTGDYCAIFVAGQGLPIKLGDKLWWQGGNVYWTTADGKDSDTFKRIGGSGVSHPLGKEFQIDFKMDKIAEQRKERVKELSELVNGFLATTPTGADGAYDPVNQYQAYKADQYMKEHKL